MNTATMQQRAAEARQYHEYQRYLREDRETDGMPSATIRAIVRDDYELVCDGRGDEVPGTGFGNGRLS